MLQTTYSFYNLLCKIFSNDFKPQKNYFIYSFGNYFLVIFIKACSNLILTQFRHWYFVPVSQQIGIVRHKPVDSTNSKTKIRHIKPMSRRRRPHNPPLKSTEEALHLVQNSAALTRQLAGEADLFLLKKRHQNSNKKECNSTYTIIIIFSLPGEIFNKNIKDNNASNKDTRHSNPKLVKASFTPFVPLPVKFVVLVIAFGRQFNSLSLFVNNKDCC